MDRSCEEFEVDCERRAHGALPEAEVPSLDAHLASCERCRRFAAVVLASQGGLAQVAEESARQVDWTRAEEHLQERIRNMARADRVAAVSFLGTIVLVWALGLPPVATTVMALGALIVVLLIRRHQARWQTELEKAQESEGGLLMFWRKQVEDELRAARRGSIALAALAIFQSLIIELVGHRLVVGRIAVHGGSAMLLGIAVGMAFIQAPRLARELRELR